MFGELNSLTDFSEKSPPKVSSETTSIILSVSCRCVHFLLSIKSQTKLVISLHPDEGTRLQESRNVGSMDCNF